MDINIRQGTLDDLEQVSEINSFGTEEGLMVAKQRLPSFIEAGNLIVAERDSQIQILGLLYFERKFFDTANNNNWFLTQITVKEDFRGKGIGEKLQAYFLQFARQNGAKKVFADIGESNIPSLKLAEKLKAIKSGYLDFGDSELRNFYRFDL